MEFVSSFFTLQASGKFYLAAHFHFRINFGFDSVVTKADSLLKP